MNDDNNHSESEQEEEFIPVLKDIIVPGEPVEQVEIEQWEPENYQPTPLQIEDILESGEYDTLIENITDEVQKNITERLRGSFYEILEETLKNTMEQCEQSIRNSILVQLRESLPDIIAKSVNKAEEKDE